ncbi:Alanine racemase [Syntrophomonas zehnderi OL-4]|uniref:Alanine racemase n=1 Tax=Syntrophomonas zehnderi OL-4 TaxID=690567 RepID=A0A0E3W2I5_9FIRM|nr:alanine racemase [Syntrophomonas zehnderi]CFX02269.1 Alanine racemase [Syntrophomonas zehnderi OL-4]
MERVLGDKWIEIDVDAIKNNLVAVNSQLEEKTRLIAVIKANAYGHGAVETARILYQNGVDFFAVSYLYEALELRKAGIRSAILVFSPIIHEDELKEAISQHITITIASYADWKLLEYVSYGFNNYIRVHLKLDTGLGRFGLTGEEALALTQEIKDHPHVHLEGIYTHMAEAASNPAYTEKQFASFMKTIHRLEDAGIKIPVKHCANSAVFLKYPHMHLDGVRLGTLLSGQYPAGKFDQVLDLKDPYCFKSRVISVRSLKKGSYLGYYRSYRLRQDAQIAVIPVGFSDGLALEVANKPAGFWDMLKSMAKIMLMYFNVPRFSLHLILNGVACPVRGKVFMQMALLEIPSGYDVNIGDEVELPVRKTLASRSITRVYTQRGKAGKISCQEGTNYTVDEM